MDESDALLVKGALDGDRQCFERIVKRYQNLVFNIAYHYLGSREEVEDLAQEVFLRVFQTLERFDTVRPLKHWIGRITVNRCLDELRKRKIRRLHLISDLSDEESSALDRLLDMSGQSLPLTELEAERCLRFLQASMAGLSDKDRMAFVLREIEGLEYRDLAVLLDTSEVAVRIRVSRARKQLQEQMEKLLYEG